jgi:ABC-2 type transport system permease protein
MNRMLILAKAQARASRRDPAAQFFTFVFPVALLIAFGRTFGQYDDGTGTLMMQSVGPQVIAFGAAYVGMFTSATSIVEWRISGMGRVLYASPVKTSTILASQFFVCLVLGLTQAAILMVVSVFPWMGMVLSIRAIATPFVIALGLWLFFSLGMMVGSLCKTIAAASGAINAVILPMAYFSGAMLPYEMLPTWIQRIGDFMPLRHLILSLEGTVTEVQPWSQVGFSATVMVTVSIVAFACATRLVRWK